MGTPINSKQIYDRLISKPCEFMISELYEYFITHVG